VTLKREKRIEATLREILTCEQLLRWRDYAPEDKWCAFCGAKRPDMHATGCVVGRALEALKP